MQANNLSKYTGILQNKLKEWKVIFKDNLFSGNVANITGGATGLGNEIAVALARTGAGIVILSRNEQNLSEG